MCKTLVISPTQPTHDPIDFKMLLSESGHLTKLNKSATACVGMHVAKTNKPNESALVALVTSMHQQLAMDISRPDLKVKKRQRQVVDDRSWRRRSCRRHLSRDAAQAGRPQRRPFRRVDRHGQARTSGRPGARTGDPGAARRRDPPDPGADRGHGGAHPHPARLDRQARHHPSGVERPDAEPGGTSTPSFRSKRRVRTSATYK